MSEEETEESLEVEEWLNSPYTKNMAAGFRSQVNTYQEQLLVAARGSTDPRVRTVVAALDSFQVIVTALEGKKNA